MTTPLWHNAFAYASRAHHGQFRKDNKTPYAAHVCRVAMIVSHVFGCDDEVAIAAAALHDVIEDTTSDYDEVEEHFGREVADCVAAMTKNMSMREDVREPAYDQQLIGADWRAKLVKLADSYDNLTDAQETNRGEQAVAKCVSRCRRALEIARTDGQGRAELLRGIEVLEAAVAGSEQT